MNDWVVRKLSDVASFSNGGNWSQAEYADSGIPVVRVSDIHDGIIDLTNCKYLPYESMKKYKEHVLYADDLVVCTVGSHPTQPQSVVGRVAIVPDSIQGTLLNQNAVRIAPRVDYVDKKWLGYLGKNPSFRNYIIQHARGSANQVRMSISALRIMEIQIPPLDVQRKIAAILTAYDKLIDNNMQRVKILEEMAQRLYREWFINFRFPGHEKVSAISSPLGLIPEEWRVAKLADMVDFIRGIEPGSKQYLTEKEDGTVPFLRVGDLSIRKSELFIPIDCAGGKFLDRTDIVLSLDGTVGLVRIGLVGAYSTGIRKVVIKDHKLLAWSFVYCLICSDLIQNVIRGHAKGTTILHAGSAINHMVFVLPPIRLMEDFEQYCGVLLKSILNLQMRIENLSQTRDLLLPKLISGEVDVEKLDINIKKETA